MAPPLLSNPAIVNTERYESYFRFGSVTLFGISFGYWNDVQTV